MDPFDEFLNLLSMDPSEPRLDDVSIEALARGRAQLEAALRELPEPALTDDEIAILRGGRFPEQQDLMYQIAVGLRACQRAGIDLGVDVLPERLEEIAELDMSIGGVLKAVEVIDRGAQTGILLCARDADADLRATLGSLAALAEDPDVPEVDQLVVQHAFADTIRLLSEAQQTDAPAPDPREVQHEQRLQQLRARGDLKQIFADFEAYIDRGAPGTQPAGQPAGQPTGSRPGRKTGL